MEKFATLFAAFATWLDGTQRVKALTDKSAWLLMAPVVAAFWAIDPALAKTMGLWTLYAVMFAGLAIIISRLVFPQINLTNFVDSALLEKNTAAAIIVAAVILFVSVVMFTLAYWAKT